MEVLAKCRRPFPLNQLHPVDSRRANLLTHMSKHIKTINPLVEVLIRQDACGQICFQSGDKVTFCIPQALTIFYSAAFCVSSNHKVSSRMEQTFLWCVVLWIFDWFNYHRYLGMLSSK